MKTSFTLLAVSLLGIASVATAQVNYFNYGGIAVVGSSPNASGDIVIASTFSGYPVGIILNSAFSGCTNLRSVTIPNSVTTIGSSVFSGCTSLTNLSVDAANPALSSLDGVLFNKAQTTLIIFPPGRGSYVIPNSVTGIGQQAFSGCTNLTNVIIGNNVTSIGQQAFSGCTGLTSVAIPNSVISIGDEAFSGCTRLTSVTIPNSVTSIGDRAFSGCTSLTSVTIPNSVTIIGDQAFDNCTNLTSATIGNGVISIGAGAFYGCKNLTRVTIPDSVTRIGTTLYASGLGGAFSGCTSLTNVIIGNSVTSIGFGAFFGCTNLTRLTIPASVINLGAYAFYSCSRLTNFTFLGNTPGLAFDMDYGGLHFAGVGAGAKAYYYCGTSGWGGGYGGLPTVMLFAPQIAPGSAGMKPGGFGFTLTCLTNQTIVVEASTNLVNWQPIWTNTPPGASTNFVDPEWLNHSNRFYRARAD